MNESELFELEVFGKLIEFLIVNEIEEVMVEVEIEFGFDFGKVFS